VSDLAELLAAHPLPRVGGDKRDRGSLVVVGGSVECPGGAMLAATAALRVGAGRVQLAVHPAVAPAVAVAFPEAYVASWDANGSPSEGVRRRLGRAAAVVVGPGLVEGGDAAALAVAELLDPAVPLLLDAGALGAASRLADRPGTVVAPNTTEAVELVGHDGDVGELAAALAEQLGGRPVAVRGVATAVADGRGGLWCNRSGDDGLGTAGSGDVVVGVAAGLLARGIDAAPALGWAVHLHATAGALAAAEVGAVGYLAREVADRIPRALAVSP
jgi:hydroxyethylthiazole kinase-like uncharacterized protein yjeF